MPRKARLDMKFHAYLFVDGSNSKGVGIGAWAAIAVSGDRRQLLYGLDNPTTISRCELKPILEGLRWIRHTWVNSPGFRVLVTSDSEYTVKTLCGIYEKNKNKELWAAITTAQEGLDVTFQWRERNTLPYMELCDRICGEVRVKWSGCVEASTCGLIKPDYIVPCYPIPEDL